ncbi:DUF6708 domain-containing protein [Pseudomonas aeruginosa]
MHEKNDPVLYQDLLRYSKGVLPGPGVAPARAPMPAELDAPPAHVDEVYMELSLPYPLRGGMLYGGLAIIAMALFLLIWIGGEFLLEPQARVKLSELWLLLGCDLLLFAAGVNAIRGDVERQRDEPIRFNRIRRKVYVHRFRGEFNPFSRRAWRTLVEEYDWDCLRARKGRNKYGEFVYIEVLDRPGGRVVARFRLAHTDYQRGAERWMLVRLYMQQGPEALPAYPNSPRNEASNVRRSLAWRLAPKAHWPREIDVLSRTASDDGHAHLSPAPVDAALLEHEWRQLGALRLAAFKCWALGLMGAVIACTAITHSPGLWRDTAIAWAWLQGAQPRTFESADALLADLPGRGWQVSLRGQGRCLVVNPDPDISPDPELPGINCNAVVWGGTGPDVTRLSLGEAWIELHDGDVFQTVPIMARLQDALTAQGQAAKAEILSLYGEPPRMSAYLDIRRMVRSVDAACGDIPRNRDTSLVPARCAALQRQIVALLDDGTSQVVWDWSDLVARVNSDPVFALTVTDMTRLVNAAGLLARRDEMGGAARARFLDEAKQYISSMEARPGFRIDVRTLSAIREEARVLSTQLLNASALVALRGVAASQRGGVLLEARHWRNASQPPVPVAWRNLSRWPPRETQDAFGRWRELQALAGEQGNFILEGMVQVRTHAEAPGGRAALKVDASQPLYAQWASAFRLLLLAAGVAAIAAAFIGRQRCAADCDGHGPNPKGA